MSHQGFFQRQSVARRNTSVLVLLFLTAVVLITLAVCLVAFLVTRGDPDIPRFHLWLVSQHGLITAAAVVGLIAAGSLVRWADLAGGGEKVARMVNARPVDPSTSDQDERRLRNVVEEMSIASGIPVPQLFIMDRDTGINAFVAGYTPGEAVLVVTHGCLTHLSRAELQGVIGHEFSHILNGDMRLNIRLISLLSGILMIGQVGSFLIRATFYSSHRRSRDSRGQAALGLIGLALVVIGYIGVFFGRLIQAAVSRQRESLADASSVQFTRNPDGIAGALYKIGTHGGYLDSTSHASDMNHMCFGESTRMKFASLLASHPPIEQRIQAIQPGMLARLRSRMRDTSQPGQQAPSHHPASSIPEAASGFAGQAPAQTAVPARELPPIEYTPTSPEGLSSRAGTVNQQAERFAVGLLERIPANFRELLYTRAGAVQFCYSLLLQRCPPDQRQHLTKLLEPHPLLGPQQDLVEKFLPALSELGPAISFPALELATPALKKLDDEERSGLLERVTELIKADGRVTLFEMALASYLRRHLSGDAGRTVPVRYRNYRKVQSHLQALFSLLARASADNDDARQKHYQEAMAGFSDQPGPKKLLPSISGARLQEALRQLNQLAPVLKPAIIDACGQCVLADGKIALKEYELIRLVADQLDCPMPPLGG